MSMIDSLEDLKNLEEYFGSYSVLIESTRTLLASIDHEKPKHAFANLTESKRTKEDRRQQAEGDAKVLDEKVKSARLQRSEHCQSIKELRDKLNKLKTERERNFHEKEIALMKLKTTTENIKRIENRPELDTTELEKDLHLFSHRFGFDLQRKREGVLTLIFHYVYQSHPEILCSFDLTIENNKYNAQNFSPDIGDVTKLIDSLNIRNNLDDFVIKIRNRFKLLEDK